MSAGRVWETVFRSRLVVSVRFGVRAYRLVGDGGIDARSARGV